MKGKRRPGSRRNAGKTKIKAIVIHRRSGKDGHVALWMNRTIDGITVAIGRIIEGNER